MDKIKKLMKGTPRHLDMLQPLGKSICDYLLINISGKCNYRCKKCCNSSPNKEVKLTLSDIKEVLHEAKTGLGIRAVAIFGEGETLMAPHYKEIIKYIDKLGLITVQFTNGYFLDRKMAEFLKAHNVSIIVSVDYLDEGRYDDFVGVKGAYRRAMKNISVARKIFAKTIEKFNSYGLYRFGINTVVTVDNKDQLAKLKKFCGEDMMFICNYPIPKGFANVWKEKIYKNDAEYEKLKKLALGASENRGFSGITDAEKCGYLFYGLSIGIDGNVQLCPYALETAGLLGNIKEASLPELNTHVKRIINGFRYRDRCARCYLRFPAEYVEFLDYLKQNRYC